MVISKRVAVIVSALLASCGALAQQPAGPGDYPNRPLRFVIGFLPGGVSDTIGRVVGERLSRELGQQILIDSRPGAGGVVAMEIVAKATPDGYTWYLAQPVLTISKLFKNKPPFDPVKALAPVTQLGTGPTVLVVHPSVPVKAVPELIALARSQREPMAYGSSGAGSTNHFAGALFAIMAKVRLLHVPYRGAAANSVAVMQGEIPMAFQPLAAAIPHLQSKRLKGIAVTGAKRARAVPELPTIGDTLPGYRVEAWYGIVVPANTPEPIIQYLSARTNKVLAMPEVGDILLKRGVEVEGSTPEQFSALIQEDAIRWKKLVEEAGIRFD